MSITADAPVPFHTDTRTLAEKLASDDREWRPHEPKQKCPEAIFGLVLERGTYFSRFDKEHHTARVLTADNVVWSVIGFHGWLQSELERKNPRVGDFVGIAFTGTKPARREGESPAFTYRVEVVRNPAAADPLEIGDASVDVDAEPDDQIGRFELRRGRFEDDLPQCNAVVASLALHHVETHSEKRELYRAILNALKPEGLVVVADALVYPEGRERLRMIEDLYAHMGRNGISATEAEVHFAQWQEEDFYVSLPDELGLLADAGFRRPDVFWRDGFIAVYGAFKGD